MPSTEQSLALTAAYRARLLTVRRQAVTTAAVAWSSLLDITDLDRSFARWLAGTVATTTRAQASAATLSDAYLSAFITAELATDVAPLGIDVGAFAGISSTGRSLAELLRPSLFTVKAAIGEDRPAAEALRLGQGRAARSVGVETDAAGRSALDEALQESPHVSGWRRVTSRRPCGACIAASTGAIQRTEKVLLVHPHCSCTKEPVVAGAPDGLQRATGSDLFHAMSKTEQDDLFAGRGGEAKAALVRNGDVALSELITHADQRSGQTVITETPLVALRQG